MTFYNNFNMESLKILELREEHLDDSSDVLTRSFLELNDIWKKHKPTYQEIYPIMRGKIIPSIHSGWSYVLVKDKKVIGLSVQYELLDYLMMPSMPQSLELFDKLGRAGKELEKTVDKESISRGEAIYGLYGVIDPDYASQGYSLKFWWNLFAVGKQAGWKHYYSRISSAVSLKMLKKLGAEVIGEVNVDEKQKLWMIRIDLSQPFPSYSMIQAMTKKKTKEPQAKL